MCVEPAELRGRVRAIGKRPRVCSTCISKSERPQPLGAILLAARAVRSSQPEARSLGNGGTVSNKTEGAGRCFPRMGSVLVWLRKSMGRMHHGQ